MTAERIECASRIEGVVVYARGAVVTRLVDLPAPLPRGVTEIVVPGITPLAEPGSFRALVAAASGPPEAAGASGPGAAREVVGVRARRVLPPAPAAQNALPAQIRELELAIARLSAEHTHLTRWRDQIRAVSLDPALARRFRPLDPAARIRDALAVSGLLADELAALDARIAELEAAEERAQRELAAAKLDAAQATCGELEDAAPPRLEVVVRLAPARRAADGAAAEPVLRIEYAVLAARWWPAYAARFSRGATQVDFQLDAFVAQASGEDWKNVRLALSTADLVQDTRLPELASLRLSRAQRPPRRGYRPAPEGLDAMFEGFDRFVASLPSPAARVAAAPGPPAAGAFAASAAPAAAPSRKARRAATETMPPPPPPPMPVAPGAPPPMPAAAPGAPPPMPVAPGAPPPAALARARMPVGLSLQSIRGGSAAPPPPPNAPPAPRSAPLDDAPRAELAAAGPMQEEPADAQAPGGDGEAPAPLDPTLVEAWLDFDALHLADAGPQRGRLVREAPGPGRRDAQAARAAVDALDGPPRAVDPRDTRGQFDHLYVGESAADVPSNARPHRVALRAARAPSTPRFVTVPREAAEVHREAHVANPFDAPLLDGPVEVFVDGALAAQTAIGRVDRGGLLRIGLGVEERIRVARNARVDESSAGLLGGSLAVDHAITVDLASSLGISVEVEVIDRIPVTDDRDVEIKLLSAQPKAEPYTQEEIGAPVRGGLRWRVPLAPGGKAQVAFAYRVQLSAKNEIVGGNRRE